MRRRRKSFIAAGTLALLAGCVWWATRDRIGFAILHSNINLEAFRAEDLERKPSIDLDLPIFGQVRYPREPAYPFMRGGSITGTDLFIDPKTSAGPIYPSNPQDPARAPEPWKGPKQYFLWSMGNERFDEIGKYSIYQTRTYIACSSVFGNAPIQAHLETNVFVGGEPMEADIRLPANGLRQPNLPTVSKSVGTWRVILEPKPWLGPGLPLRYSVAVSDSQGSSFQVKSDWPPTFDFLPDPPKYEVLSCPNAPGAFTWHTQQQSALIINKHLISMHLTRLVRTPITLRAHRTVEVQHLAASLRSATITHQVVELLGPDGKVQGSFAWRDDSFGSWGSPSEKVPALEVVLGGVSYFIADAPFSIMKNLKEGQSLEGVLYKGVEEKDTSIELKMPELEQFLGIKQP